jgi:hypothetical protein
MDEGFFFVALQDSTVVDWQMNILPSQKVPCVLSNQKEFYAWVDLSSSISIKTFLEPVGNQICSLCCETLISPYVTPRIKKCIRPS